MISHHGPLRSGRNALFVASTLLALSGCGSKEEDVGVAPVAQLQGSWMMVNRAVTCETSRIEFGASGIYRLHEKKPRKKYATIQKFTIGPAKVGMVVTGLEPEPEKELTLMFSVENARIRLINLTDAKGESYKTPAKSLGPDVQTLLKALYHIHEIQFAMDQCPA